MPRRHGKRRKDKETGRLEKFPLLAFFFLSLWLCGAASVAPQIRSFEKEALASARKTPASGLDEALPDRLFADWFKEIVGPKAGVVWQLTECGEQIGAPGQPGHDLQACVEINATLPDGLRAFIAISVGTFKKGLIGKPTFFRAVIEHNEQFYQVRRLRDLPKMLRAPVALSAAGAKNRIADPPAIQTISASIIAHSPHPAPQPSGFPPFAGDSTQPEQPPPPAPSPEILELTPESVSQSRAISRVKPDYPPTARKMNATGTVEVEILISEAGLVIEARAVSGHLALRSAAVEAARKWIFEPVKLNGRPVKVKSVLTFVFAPSAR